MRNQLYYGDNLHVMREHIPSESIDLLYLDPPFNSQATYNILFKGKTGKASNAQIEAFEDTWHWGEQAERAFSEVLSSEITKAAEMISAFRSFLGENDMMAYLSMMAVRLIEIHRVLKTTGSIYLHCDPTASHYLKILLDSIFGPTNFLNEIVWKRTGTHSSARRWGPVHDIIFFYAKSAGEHVWNRPYVPLSEKHLTTHYRKVDKGGRRYEHGELTGAGIRQGRSGVPWRGFDVASIGRHWVTTVERLDELHSAGRIHVPEDGGWPRLVRYEDESKGRALGDVWEDISPINMRARERLGYPTQKPTELLCRIVAASSNSGDIVLDPFCGCGTTIHAAQKLDRNWIGIDITHLAISLIERRLKDAFPGISFDIHGTPKDLESALDLAARDKYQFQWWAVSLVDARPYGGKKKGADSGIDGILFFHSEKKVTQKALISVKGGESVGVGAVRDLIAVVEREKAAIGVLICLALPTRQMEREAAAAGLFEPEGLEGVPRIQIITLAELFQGKRPRIPRIDLATTFKTAARETPDTQKRLL